MTMVETSALISCPKGSPSLGLKTLVLKTLILLACCSGAAIAEDSPAAQARWADAGITDYSFTLTQRVMWGATTIVLIEVRDGALLSADHIIKRTNPVPDHPADDNSGLRKTIDDLLADIQTRNDFIRASFDPELGYPVDMYFRNADWDEAEDQFEIRDFKVLDSAD